MGNLVEKIGCKLCGSSDGLQVYEEGGKFTGFCFVCNKYYHNPYGEDEPHTKEVRVTTKEELHKQYFDIVDRKISADTCKYFEVEVGINNDGEIKEHYYPMKNDTGTIGHKIRVVKDKSFLINKSGKTTKMFGEDQAMKCGAKKLFVVEGEVDAMSLYQALKSNAAKNPKFANFHPAVVSPANGASSLAKELAAAGDLVDRFEEVVLMLDTDAAGIAATEASAPVYPAKTFIVKLPLKDPNEMLLAGREGELVKLAYNSKSRYAPDSIVTLGELREEILAPVTIDVTWPWPTLNNKMYGLRRTELYLFGGGAGCGKTELFKEHEYHLVNYHKLPIAAFMLEEAVSHTAKSIAGKFCNKRFHIPDGDWTQEELEGSLDYISSLDIYLYKSKGVMEWDKMQKYIRYLALSEGVKDFFIDNLTALVAKHADKTTMLDRILAEQSELCEELGITIYEISHLTRPSGGQKPHEEGGRVHQSDFRGSGSIQFWSNAMFGIERNTQAEDEEERNTATLRCLKDRFTGEATGLVFPLYFNKHSGRLLEV